jgi:hypothetical protein
VEWLDLLAGGDNERPPTLFAALAIQQIQQQEAAWHERIFDPAHFFAPEIFMHKKIFRSCGADLLSMVANAQGYQAEMTDDPGLIGFQYGVPRRSIGRVPHPAPKFSGGDGRVGQPIKLSQDALFFGALQRPANDP